MIYHYTTLQVFNDILNQYRQGEDKDNLIFWASSIYMMNDDTEMGYGWEVLKACLQKIEHENDIADPWRLSTFMETVGKEPYSLVFDPYFYNMKKSPFVISFSRKKDFLPMWSLYGAKGRGVCIGFDDALINPNVENMSVINPLGVIYANQRKNDVSTFRILKEVIYSSYQDYLKDKMVLDTVKMDVIRTMISVISGFIKDGAYAYEQEKRLVVLASDVNPQIHFRTSIQGNIIPYVKVPIPVKSMKQILVGPCLQPANVVQSLSWSLQSCGLTRDISVSKVPYREI